jgi:hypothetical protein
MRRRRIRVGSMEIWRGSAANYALGWWRASLMAPFPLRLMAARPAMTEGLDDE